MRPTLAKLLYTESEAATYLELSLSFLQKSRTQGSTKIIDGLAPAFVKHIGGIRYCAAELRRFRENKVGQDFYQKPKAQPLTGDNSNAAGGQQMLLVEDSEFDWSAGVFSSIGQF